MRESSLLDSIGSGSDGARNSESGIGYDEATRASMMQETGLSSSLSDEEIKRYLGVVLDESSTRGHLHNIYRRNRILVAPKLKVLLSIISFQN